MRPSRRRFTAPLAALVLITTPLALAQAPAGAAVPAPRPANGVVQAVPPPAAPTTRWTWKPRGEQYPGTVTTTDLAITMSDGVVLRGDLTVPADDTGAAIDGRFPVVVTITAYNKTAIGGGGMPTNPVTGQVAGLGGPSGDYLVKRGYASLVVDARGTGSSEGTWEAFAQREDDDAGEVMTWAARAPFSNGSTAMTGPSYMGISQLFAAGARPEGLKAIFPQVPGYDVYRDVVASGGQVDVGFMPLWLGLVTTAGLIPPAVTATAPASGLRALLSHLGGAARFTAPVLLKAMAGEETAYDGPFYEERSVKRVLDRVEVPTFLIGGEYDLFQRGTPMIFDNLRRRGVPVKMILGPWDHLQGSGGGEVAQAGHGSLNELQLRWFDHYVKGMPDPGLSGDSDIAPLTYYEIGTGRWRTSTQWVGKDRTAQTFKLSGVATAGRPAALTDGAVTSGTSTVAPIPVAGLCTRSMNQWTAGAVNQSPLPNPCLRDNAPNDELGVVFETAPVTTAITFQGPIAARLHTSTPAGDGMLSLAIEDVAPDGTVDRITGGWQVISHRALDEDRTRRLDGRIIQPFHPFTKEAKEPLSRGEIAPIDVEIFPTGASIQPGHRLRLAVQAFDVPHLLPTLPDLVPTSVPLRIHTSAARPSTLTIPGITGESTDGQGRLALSRRGPR